MPTTWKDILINVDLHAPASVYLDQLETWKELAKSAAAGQTLSRLVYRYEHLWLPLVASWTSDDELEPPNDVHWIWHLHQLQTESYTIYCNQRFGRVLPHHLRALRPAKRAIAVQLTAGAWRQRYPGEPFDLKADEMWMEAAAVDSAVHAPSPLVDQLTAIARRETDFTYQVALPHMRDANFLYAAVERYRKLLLLRLRDDEIAMTALPVDILLMIRVHLLHPTQLVADMRRLFGDWTAAAAPAVDWESLEYNAPPPDAVQRSEHAWQRQFGRHEALFVDGSGLRGCRAGSAHCGGDDTAMRQLPPELLSRSGVDSCYVTFTSVTVDELWYRAGVKRVSVEARLLGQNSLAREILFRVSGSIGAPISGGDGATSALGSAQFSVGRNRGIELAIFGRRGVLCFARKRNLTTKTFNPIQHCPVISPLVSASTTVILPKVTYTDPKITLAFNVQVDRFHRFFIYEPFVNEQIMH